VEEYHRSSDIRTLKRPHIEVVCASDVITKEVEWLWAGRIPKGKLTMFDGDPDVGKSVVTMDLSARVSTGRTFPDGAPCEVGNVLIANLEDAKDDTIVPRLKAHGADLSRIRILDGMLDIPRDVPLLEQYVEEYEIALLIIDPVLTVLGGDANKDQDSRKALTPVKDMAERTDVAVVAVRHLNKNVSLSAIQRGGGNMGLIGVARAGAFFAYHPDEDGQRVMAPHKSNLAEKPASLAFRLVNCEVHGNVPRVEWHGATEHDANSLTGSSTDKTELDAAKEFLRAELADGPMWSKQVFKDAHDAGVAQKTLYRAKDALRVKSEKVGVEGWQWSLPQPDPPKGGHPQSVGHVDHVDHVQSRNGKHSENSAYIYEGGQGGQGGQATLVEHVHDHLQDDKRHSQVTPDPAQKAAKEEEGAVVELGREHPSPSPAVVEDRVSLGRTMSLVRRDSAKPDEALFVDEAAERGYRQLVTKGIPPEVAEDMIRPHADVVNLEKKGA
jgi:hypothetical protein